MSQPLSFYFHDYETWGADPKRDRPAQFAGIRTDADLNIIGEPDVWYCQLANDYLPHPQAALITGLTPQLCNKKGLPETEFMRQILSRFSEPGSCVLGYNSLRFDDEVTRYSLYRNFYEPYGREWQQGNSRWDLIDVVRACYALRPEGINWPLREDGSPSFKLEHLSKANGLAHEHAHDALSDVYATIGIARLIKDKQSKLFSYLFELRKKTKAAELIDVAGLTPLVHVSSKFPASTGCVSWIVPLAFHPTNTNAVICYNLQADPSPLLTDDLDTLQNKLYTRTADLAEGEERLGLKLIHLNKCPVLANAKTLSVERAAELGINRARCLEHLEWFKQHRQLQQKVVTLYQQPLEYPTETNPDYQLYNGFISDADKQKMQQLHQLSADQLAINPPLFSDERLNSLLFLYRSRNYPQSLNDPEQHKWQRYRTDKLMHGLDNPNLTMEEFSLALENLAHEYASDEQKMKILKSLYLYVQSL
ncbi:exodeoxyribonuclease I [Arsukibacterium sp.]|uniref:exodeoxyribonuclease I n=1 Tax=Arsukibacterium sp. TaxID=1977258 RepID=UPI00299EC525|nr:exodeoxyribonuclease I [Arsukibacterium sp.]MDX1676662.1 exodeoxyribonuclease I [Arsukibacterium sp.]